MVLSWAKYSFVQFAKLSDSNRVTDYLEAYKKGATEGLALEVTFGKLAIA